jgi:sulfatase maturation enzyme AslB (radical SAM superfamily)
MKMGVFFWGSYGDPFEPVTLIEAYQAWLGPIWSITPTFLRRRHPLAKHGRDLWDDLFDHSTRTHLTGRAMGLLRIKPILQTWGRTLRGRAPSLSIEITRECPLRCPGCYAYEDAHLGTTNLRSLSDFKGQELIARVLALMDQYKPLHLSIVGGEPLVRYRELDVLLPQLVKRAHIQVVTSAFRPIPLAWAALPNLQLVVSIDGLQPEHDLRRKPATYERILRNIRDITLRSTAPSPAPW